jgi:cytochrome c-type biogenesis protein CcmH
MTTFWIAIFVLIFIALLVIWKAFSRADNANINSSDDIRKETNITLYHEHLHELEKDLAEGGIGQSSFLQLKTELDKTLLQDVSNGTVAKKSTSKLAVLWPATVAVFVVAISFYIYSNIGAYSLMNQPAVDGKENPHSNINPEQMAVLRVEQLQQQVAAEPTNAEAWFSLGQAHIATGEFDHAVKSFDQVIMLVGEYADLIGQKAQALYYKNNHRINEEVQALIDKALALDSADTSTNVLLGMDSFGQSHFAKAIEYWERVLNSGRPGINVVALTGAINEAKNQMKIASEMSSGAIEQETIDPNKPHLTIDVALSEEIEHLLREGDDKTVFVYAIAAGGPRMPLAAVKVNTSDLPLSIVLDDSRAMTPQMRLSSVDKVHVYAVVSMQGSVGIKPGDFKAEALDVNVLNRQNISLNISVVVQ